MAKIICLILLFSVNSFAKDCIPSGTAFEDLLRNPDFKIKNVDAYIKEFSGAITKMAKYRNQNCEKATPQNIFDNCRSACLETKVSYGGYKRTCTTFCAVQKLQLESHKELAQCEGKLDAITQIEKSLREQEDSANQ
jgi:hypothetical protein